MGSTFSKSESPGSPYHGQRLRIKEIRLLTIKSSGGVIKLNTHRYNLSEDPDYDAISYVWGTAPASVTVMCNNRPLLITPTALEMLKYLQQYQAKTATRKIWIDAICINQADQEEKSTQVPLMRDIYSRAATVLVWMGPSTPETDVFFVEFQDVRMKSKAWIALFDADRNRRGPAEEELPCDVYAFFEGLSHLLKNEWFRRLWTYQEIILPSKATLLCGESWVGFDEFLDFVFDGYFRSTYLAGIMNTERNVRTHTAVKSCYFIYFLRSSTSQRERTKTIDSQNVTVNLYQLRHRHVKEPVDRVWAIAGLLESNPRHSLTSEVDYSEKGRAEYWKTWIMFAKALINEPGGMTLLNIPPTLEPRASYLPSWCPNLSGRSACNIAIDWEWNATIAERPWFVRWAMFEENSEAKCAARTEAIVNHEKRFISTSKHDSQLRIRGFVLDIIEEIVEHRDVLDIRCTGYDKDSEEHMTLYNIAVGHHMDALDLARHVYYGKSEGVSDIPEDFVIALFLDHRITENARDIYHEITPKLATWFSASGFGSTWEQAQCHGQLKYTRGHTFFSTKGGRIGFAHPGCKPGDQIAAFYGGEALYILRQWNPTKGDIDSTGQASDDVQYMGAAFIPHLMEQHQRDAARIGPDTMFMIH